MKIDKLQFAKGLENLLDVALGEIKMQRTDIKSVRHSQL